MKKIDYKEPTHRLKEVMFDVKLQGVYSMFMPSGEIYGAEISSPNYKAVVILH